MTRPTLTPDEVQRAAADALARKRAASRRLSPDEIAEVAAFYYERAVALGHAKPIGGGSDGR